jgi:hypothetical protein
MNLNGARHAMKQERTRLQRTRPEFKINDWSARGDNRQTLKTRCYKTRKFYQKV